MKALTNLITAIIIAFWLGAIAIFSIQNITAISLQFLAWESMTMPVGILLSFSAAGGIIFGTLLVPLLRFSQPRRRKRSLSNNQELDEFDF